MQKILTEYLHQHMLFRIQASDYRLSDFTFFFNA
jgi:hypothetical protein